MITKKTVLAPAAHVPDGSSAIGDQAQRSSVRAAGAPSLAGDLVAALESLELGAPWDAQLAAAESAIAVMLAAAVAIIFPSYVVAATADTLALYSWHVARIAPSGYWQRLAAIHARAMNSAPALCLLLRSREAIEDIEAAAGSLAIAGQHETHATAAARAAAEARCKYECAIAEQLAESGGDLAAPARQLIAADVLAGRLAAARAKHEAHARAAAEQAAADLRAAEAAAEQARIEAAVEREIAAELKSRGLPPDLKAIPFAEQERARIEQLARTRVRLRTARVPTVRIHGRLYNCGELSLSIGSATAEELGGIIAALDRAEAEVRPS